jgi:hypothetical protein
MPTGNLSFKEKPADNADTLQHRPDHREEITPSDDEDLDTYIKVFVENGLKLRDELIVHHEAIAAAQREHLAEFQR